MIQDKIQINNQEIFTVTGGNPDADISIILTHGYAEHIMRYKSFMEELIAQGYRVLGYDHRGHGQSSGSRAMINDFDYFADDLNSIAKKFFRENQNNFIFGHSMGGTVLLRYLQKYGDDGLAGVITSGAALKPDDSIPKILVKLSSIIANILPGLPTIKLDSKYVSRDPIEVQKYDNDPLNYRGGTKAKFGDEFLKAMKLATNELSKISIPILINHGTADRMIDPESAEWLHNGVSSEDKTLKKWDGFYHELLNDYGKENVSKIIIDWINSHS